MKKHHILFGIVLIIIALGLSSATAIYKIPNTSETREITKTIERAYRIEAEAALTFDTTAFPTVFINDPRFPSDAPMLEVVRDMTHNSALEAAGHLDYKLAYYTWCRDGVLQLEELQKKATVENRELTKAELQSLRDSKGRTAPARAEGPIKLLPLKFISIEVNEDVATVIVNDGPTITQITLVLVDGQWYIAQSNVLIVNL